jgi:hypothetical protein
MRRLILILVVILAAIVLFVIVSYCRRSDDVQDEEQTINELHDCVLVLQIPEIDVPAIRRKHNTEQNIVGQEIVSSRDIITIEFKLTTKDNKSYLVHEPPKFLSMSIFNIEPWNIQEEQSIDDYLEKWNITITAGNNIQIDGFLACEFFFHKYELSAVRQKSGVWIGTGLISYCAPEQILEPYSRIIQINWRLFRKDQKIDVDEKLKTFKLLRDWPEPKLKEVQRTVEEIDMELQKSGEIRKQAFSSQPLLNQLSFSHGKRDFPDDKLRGVVESGSGVEPRKRLLYARDKIIPEINWDEIGDLPEALFIFDHLVTVEETDIRNYIWQAECRDKSGDIFINQDLEKFAKIPLLFLFTYYHDWLTEERVNKLSKVSNRIKLIVAEVKKYGNDSPNKLDEIMTTVLSKLSDKERRDYFVKSLKLRNYVKESNNLSLQKLMPNDLPPPPGPPENMRDWVGRDGSIDHGTFLRLEDDPDRGKVLVILDADRIEVRLGFRYMTKETQRYITEMLEAQAEDAAEAKKNIDTPAQENK